MSDLILFNGDIRTQDPDRPRARAMAVLAGRIAALGDDNEIKALARPGVEAIDLEGALVLPGLTDSHIHFHDWALNRLLLPLGRARTKAEFLEMIASGAGRTEEGGWVAGRGFDEAEWPEASFPDLAELDRAAQGRPALLYRRDMHLCLANTAAMELAGVGPDTPEPREGQIDRDQWGRPAGVFREQAMDLITRVVPPPTEDQAVEAMAEALPVLAALGLTGIQDQRIWKGYDGQSSFRSWQRLHREGRLSLRCWMNLAGEHLDEAITLGLRTGMGDDFLRVGHLKYFTDGSMGSTTAWVLEPFTSGGTGITVCSMEELAADLKKAEANGLATAVHAIGDRAVRTLVGIHEDLARFRREEARTTPPPWAPHRIEHVQMIRPEDIKRLAGLGVFASVQPLHITDDITIHDRNLGPLAKHVYPFRSMLAAGVPLASGSDCPVSDPNPLWGIHAAVTRRRRGGSPEQGWYPDQRLTVEQTVASYTLGPARVSGREAELGSLAPGKLGDAVVLDRDIFAIDPQEIHQAKPLLTVVGGRVVYRA